jgi:hypothetical protein
MKPIKFRVFADEAMLPVVRLEIDTYTSQAVVALMSNENETCHWHFPISMDSPFLMQFTGIVDEEGKEIYDGDILMPNDGHPVVVTWDVLNNRWVYYECNDDSVFPWSIYGVKMHSFRVVGNRFQTPELIPEHIMSLLPDVAAASGSES